MSSQPVYSQEQIRQYFEYVGFPFADSDPWAFGGSSGMLFYLTQLIRCQLSKVPFENLDLHYSPVHGVSLDPEWLFDKIVVRNRGRGGYCMQNNLFFACILRSLGFKVISVGARISKSLNDVDKFIEPENTLFTGFSHQVNIVYIETRSYVVDVGFGGAGPTIPMDLVHDETGDVNVYSPASTAADQIVTSSTRLIRSHIGNHTSTSRADNRQKLWISQVKYSYPADTSKPWISRYCFGETEFFPADFDIMNNDVSKGRGGLFVDHVLCSKFIPGEVLEGGAIHGISGDITTFDDSIKEHRNGKTRVLCEIKTEEDRINALEKYMDIKLTTAERRGIRGLKSALSEA